MWQFWDGGKLFENYSKNISTSPGTQNYSFSLHGREVNIAIKEISYKISKSSFSFGHTQF